MNNILTWCEIPVTDMQRAKAFYSKVIDVSFNEEDMDGFKMAIFKSENPEAIGGALTQGDGYVPSKTASIPYLWGGQDLTTALDRAVELGGKIAFPKTAIKDGGFFAQFIDSEGNRVGLFSPT